MLLSTLEVSELKEVAYQSAAKDRAAKAGVKLHRKVYDRGDIIIKLWPADWQGWNVVVEGSRRRRFAGPEGSQKVLPGTVLGIYDRRTVPAFGEYIYTDQGHLVGYTTRRGTVIDKGEVDATRDCIAFVDDLIARALLTGYILRDLHAGNLIRLSNGRLSLIDLETPLARLDMLDLNFEVTNGALRRGTSHRYRQFICNYVEQRQRKAGTAGLATSVTQGPGSSDLAWILEAEQELLTL